MRRAEARRGPPVRVLRWMAGTALALALMAGGAMALALAWTADAPAVSRTVHLQPATLAQAHTWVQAARGDPGVPVPRQVTLPGADADALLHDLTRRLLRGGAQLQLADGRAEVAFSVPWARLPLPAPVYMLLQPLATRRPWLNVRATLQAQPTGLPTLGTVWLGSVPVPGPVATWAVQQALQRHALSAEAALGLAAVQRVVITPGAVSVRFEVDDTLKARARALLLPADEAQRLRAYHDRLAWLLQAGAGPGAGGAAPPPVGDVPMIDLLVPLVALAAERSVGLPPGAAGDAQAAAENRAAVLALALVAGGIPPGRLVPDAHAWPALPAHNVLLHGRIDLAQHFLLSAVLAAGVGGRLTDLIGVYKELADAGSQGRAGAGGGGSGFSFNDLAADRAGVRYGQRALREPRLLQARTLQARRDDDFMPAVDDLPQYLSPAELQARVGAVGSPAYEALVADIERRVGQAAVLK